MGDILKQFFEKFQSSKKVTDDDIAEYFLPHADMMAPMEVGDNSVLQGTIQDRKCMACYSATQGVFAMGVIVNAGGDLFSVFAPNHQHKTIDIYFDFLKSPPSSLAVKVTRFCPPDSEGDGRWEIPPGDHHFH